MPPLVAAHLPKTSVVCGRVSEVRAKYGDLVVITAVAAFMITGGGVAEAGERPRIGQQDRHLDCIGTRRRAGGEDERRERSGKEFQATHVISSPGRALSAFGADCRAKAGPRQRWSGPSVAIVGHGPCGAIRTRDRS